MRRQSRRQILGVLHTIYLELFSKNIQISDLLPKVILKDRISDHLLFEFYLRIPLIIDVNIG